MSELPRSYLTQFLPTLSEDLYTDFSAGKNSVKTRPRLLDVGANINLLMNSVDETHILEPAPVVYHINQAILRASRNGGGVVKPKAGGLTVGNSDVIYMEDGVILDMQNVPVTHVNEKKDDFIFADEKENFAVTNLDVDGNLNRSYAFRAVNSRNFIILRHCCPVNSEIGMA